MVEVFRDPVLRHWTSHVVENEADGARWVRAQQRGWAAGNPLETLTSWAFGTFEPDGLECLELLHQVGNLASCQVARKSRYNFDSVLPAAPPAFPHEGHLHIRHMRA